MQSKWVPLNSGTKIVTMPHIEIYGFLIDIVTRIGEAQRACDSLKSRVDIESAAFAEVYRRRSFYASAARIYPALFLEAYLNFVATQCELQFRGDFERFAAHKKLSLYVFLLTNRAIDPKYVEFVKRVFALRDFEAHPKSETTIVGKPTNKNRSRYESNLYRMCTLTTIICSINKLVTEISTFFSSTKYKMPAPLLRPLEYPTCHFDENSRFRIV